ncbi:MAG TPA: type II toxin-antitoxin system RelE/ParE family toxin [Blastocatellia bacterium]|nr:type II toxin-antitoxin system RelE/ParE family toxin [Blastocatellia bacterium]
MAGYNIEVTEDARADLKYYTIAERKIVVSQIKVRLEDQPSTETRNRKKLRDNPIATWELRIGKFRVFYEVDEPTRLVTITVVGHKEHNILYVRGIEVRI